MCAEFVDNTIEEHFSLKIVSQYLVNQIFSTYVAKLHLDLAFLSVVDSSEIEVETPLSYKLGRFWPSPEKAR